MSAPAGKDAGSAAESVAADHYADSADEPGEQAGHRHRRPAPRKHRHRRSRRHDGDRMDAERDRNRDPATLSVRP